VGFTKVSNPEDEVFVLAFNEDVREIWAPRVLALSNMASMRASLLGGIGARGKTALHDAIAEGLDRLDRGKHTRQVLVVLSDGSDNASAHTLDTVLARTRAAEAAIFTVMLRDPIDGEGNPKLLKRLAEDTGGEYFDPNRLGDVPETLEHIARDIRSAYTIGYVPTKSGERALHKLKVSVRSPDGRVLKARTRAGYVARAQS
jgi:VWFA-related protein